VVAVSLGYTNTTSSIYSCNSDGTGLTKLVDNIDEFSDVK
jgi:hypothetical protein